MSTLPKRVPMMSVLGLERRVDPYRARTRIGRRGYAALALMAAVFACFFAIGRATGAGGSSAAQTQPSLPVASASAAIPEHLGSTAPIDVGVLAPPPAPARATGSSSSHAAAAAAPAAVNPPRRLVSDAPVVRAPTPVTAPAPVPAPVRVAAPVHTPAPVGAPTPQRLAPVNQAPAPSRRSSAPATHSAPSEGGGGSFDSSG